MKTAHTLLRTSLGALALVALLCGNASVSISAEAGAYFVSTSGDDGNSGTSADTPWRTLGKVNATQFKPGDKVLFKRGDVWTKSNGGGQLSVSASGASGSARIVYGAYGTGDKPVFDGAGLEGRGALVSRSRFVTVQDLAFRHSPLQGVDLQGCNHVSLLRVDVTSNGKGPAINAKQGGHLLIDGCVVTDAGSNGIHFGGSPTDRIHDSTIQNCIVKGTRANDGIVIHADSTPGHNPAGANFIIRNNTASGCAEQGFDITAGTHVTLENNHSHDNRTGAITIGHQASNVILRCHRSENEPTADTSATVNISTRNVIVEYSRFTGGPHSKPVVNLKKHDLKKYPADFLPEDIILRNNVLVWKSPEDGAIFKISDENGLVETHRLTVLNNIFYSATDARILFDFTNPRRPPNHNGGADGGFTIQNNVYFSPGGVHWRIGSDPLRTFAAYRSGFPPADSIHSLEGDPLFVNAAAGDYRLRPESPARDKGHTAPGMSATDIEGVSVPMGAARDIGAYEASLPRR